MRNRLSTRKFFFCFLSIVMLSSSSFESAGETNMLEATPTQLKKLSLEDLMQLDVTSASRRPVPYQQAAAAIQVITEEDMRHSGASSIPEALRLANNLQVAQIDSRNWAITARGFNSSTANKLLVMIDGRTVYTPLFSGVFWDVQDYLLEDVDRIEVISGPGATLYGANAVNGVINIISKNAKETQGLLLTGGGGTELRYFGGLRYGGMLSSNVAYRIYGKYFDRDDTVFANGKNGQDDWRMGQGGFRLDWNASEENTVTFQGDVYNGAADQTIGDEVTMGGGNFLSRWEHDFSDESSLSVQVYYDRTHRRIPGIAADDLNTYDLDIDHSFSIGERQKFIWGLGYRLQRDDLDNAVGTGTNLAAFGFFPERLDRHLASAFVQDEIMLHENLFLTLGTKVEHNDYTGIEVQPSGRLSWNVTSKQLIWSAISRAVRTPSRIDRHLYAPGVAPGSTNLSLAGGPGFESETLIAYELGYRVQPHPRLSSSVSAFYNDYDNIRSLRPRASAPAVIANDVEGESYGFETDVTWQLLEWWRLRAGYIFLEKHLREKSGRIDLNNAQSEGTDPEQQASLQSSMNLPGNLEIDARLRWVDELHPYSGGTRGSVPAYFSLDLRLGWSPAENWEFSIVGQNLLDEQHPEFGFPNANRHEIQRSVYGKVTWHF